MINESGEYNGEHELEEDFARFRQLNRGKMRMLISYDVISIERLIHGKFVRLFSSFKHFTQEFEDSAYRKSALAQAALAHEYMEAQSVKMSAKFGPAVDQLLKRLDALKSEMNQFNASRPATPYKPNVTPHQQPQPSEEGKEKKESLPPEDVISKPEPVPFFLLQQCLNTELSPTEERRVRRWIVQSPESFWDFCDLLREKIESEDES